MEYLKHETIERIFFSKEKFPKDSKILIIDTTDYVTLFDLGDYIEDKGKIVVLTEYIKDLNQKVKDFGYSKKILVINKKVFYKIKSKTIDYIIWISPNLKEKDFLDDISLTYKFLKEDGKLYILFDKEMKLLEEFKVKLLHKADINETIGILEKIGFKKPFFEKNYAGRGLSIYIIIAKKIEPFISPFE